MEFTRLEPTSVNTSAEFTFANIAAGNVKTDNLLYANGAPYTLGGGGGGGTPGGSNSQIQYNATGSFAGSANLTFDSSTKTLTVDRLVANGAGLTSLTGANVTGTVANATYATTAGSATTAGTVTTGSQPNITSVGTLSSLNVTANVTSGNATLGNLVTANYFTGNGSLLTSIAGANVTGTVANATYATSAGSATTATTATTAATVTTAAQPNITSLGTLTSVTVSGNITAGNANLGNLVTANYFTGNGSLLTSLTGANVTGTVANATYATTAGSATTAATVTTAAQPNITSLGTLTSLTSGLITATSGGIKVGNIQDPSGTNTISIASGVVTMVGNLTIGTSGSGNLTASNANLGNLVVANYVSGNGSLLTSLTGANITGWAPNANIANTVTVGAQPNITSTGNLVSLNVVGTAIFASSQDVTVSGAPSGTVDYDLYNGVVFDVTPSANWTANVSNIATTNNRTTVITFIVNQGSTPYVPNVFQISGTPQTVKWINGTTPTGTASKIDVISYSLIRSNVGAWTVLGQTASFG